MNSCTYGMKYGVEASSTTAAFPLSVKKTPVYY